MKCLNCNYEFDGDNTNCPACGSDKIEITNDDSSICSNCHAPLNGSLKCEICGYDPTEKNNLTTISEEQQEKIEKVAQVIGIGAFLITFGPFIGMILLVGLGIGVFFLLGKGILTVNQLIGIVKVLFIIVPIILVLIFFKFKKDDKMPVVRAILLIIAVIFVIGIILYNTQTIFRFEDYGKELKITQDGYTIPTIQSIYEGKSTNSFKIKDNETKGTAYTISYEGVLPDDALNKYIDLLVGQGYIKVDANDSGSYYYAKYDGKYSLCIEIHPNEPVNYTDCYNDDCITKTTRNQYTVQYWFIPGDYSNFITE